MISANIRRGRSKIISECKVRRSSLWFGFCCLLRNAALRCLIVVKRRREIELGAQAFDDMGGSQRQRPSSRIELAQPQQCRSAVVLLVSGLLYVRVDPPGDRFTISQLREPASRSSEHRVAGEYSWNRINWIISNALCYRSSLGGKFKAWLYLLRGLIEDRTHGYGLRCNWISRTVHRQQTW